MQSWDEYTYASFWKKSPLVHFCAFNFLHWDTQAPDDFGTGLEDFTTLWFNILLKILIQHLLSTLLAVVGYFNDSCSHACILSMSYVHVVYLRHLSGQDRVGKTRHMWPHTVILFDTCTTYVKDTNHWIKKNGHLHCSVFKFEQPDVWFT